MLPCLALIVGGLTGCVELPPLNFNPPNVGPADQRLDAELKSTVITVARPEEKMGPLEIDTYVENAQMLVPELWKTGLEDALNRLLIFRDDGVKKLNLNVKILEYAPAGVRQGPAHMIARYELVDRNDGAVYLAPDVSSEGDAPSNFAPGGPGARNIEATNRAVQNNISTFLQQLQLVELSKPILRGRRS